MLSHFGIGSDIRFLHLLIWFYLQSYGLKSGRSGYNTAREYGYPAIKPDPPPLSYAYALGPSKVDMSHAGPNIEGTPAYVLK